MLRGRRAAIATALAIATAAVVAGCGGGSDNSAKSALPLDPVAAAATKTQNAGAARIRFSVAIGGPELQGQMVRLRGAGAIDGSSTEMSFRLASLLGQMGIPAAAKAKLGHGVLKAIALQENGDYVMYMDLGFLSSQIPGGKKWIKLDFSKLGEQNGFGDLLSGNQFEPSDLLSLLKSEGATVDKLGQATVDGSATTHYRATIDLAKALQSRGVTSPLLSAVAGKMKDISEDVWIGRNGLVRRIRASYGFTEAGQHVSFAMSMDIYDYGAHITIAAPPSSEVFDGTQLAQKGFGSTLP
jgi:hypothetical protein